MGRVLTALAYYYFLEGIITFISPCLLPMLPIYISYFAGGGERSVKISPDQLVVQDRAQPQENGNGESSRDKAHLSNFVGKPVVLNFWASWCNPCQREMPDFDEAYAEMGEEIHFLMVNMTTSNRESLAKATAFIDEQGYSFPVFYDLDGAAAAVYGMYSLPSTYFIDAEGYVGAQVTGAINRETLEKGISMITEQ